MKSHIFNVAFLCFNISKITFTLMCGITGIYAFNEIGKFFMINLVNATKSLESRGPDQQGTIIHENIGLGHRRLSILDTSLDGKQPMSDETGRYTIVFNGEIYNFKEIKKELEVKGHSFKSGTDTEVLLRLFILEGKNCLNKLNGFFAFAIFDKQDGSVFIARDRMGIKPLHIYQDEDKLIFGSELKSIMAYNIPKEIDYASLIIYLQLNYIPPPYSILKNVRKLIPGHYMVIKGKQVFEDSYYKIPYDSDKAESNNTSYDDLQKELVNLLDESVQKRMISDVPLGAFLSGGIDSSAIVALASRHTDKLNTYSIGFKDNKFFDETEYAQLVADKYKTNHTVFKISNDDLLSNYKGVLDYIDEPFADSSALAVNILAKETKKHVTVALSGDGADEMFGGYNKYMGEYKVRSGGMLSQLVCSLLPLWKVLPKSRNSFIFNKVRQFERFSEGRRSSARDRYWKWASFVQKEEAFGLLNSSNKDIEIEVEERIEELMKDFGAGSTLNDVLYNDMHMVLQGDMLPKVDFMSMKNSLEVRVPFLDHNVVEFAFNLPSKYKISGGMKKKIVQDTFRDLLPSELYNRPKQGFDVPLKNWYETDLKGTINELLGDDFLEEQNIFNKEKIGAIKKNVLKGGDYDQEEIWNLISLQSWWKNTLL